VNNISFYLLFFYNKTSYINLGISCIRSYKFIDGFHSGSSFWSSSIWSWMSTNSSVCI